MEKRGFEAFQWNMYGRDIKCHLPTYLGVTRDLILGNLV